MYLVAINCRNLFCPVEESADFHLHFTNPHAIFMERCGGETLPSLLVNYRLNLKNEKLFNSNNNRYWIHSHNFISDRKAKFKDSMNVNLLFLGHEPRPCLAGGTFGGNEDLCGKPFIDIPTMYGCGESLPIRNTRWFSPLRNIDVNALTSSVQGKVRSSIKLMPNFSCKLTAL